MRCLIRQGCSYYVFLSIMNQNTKHVDVDFSSLEAPRIVDNDYWKISVIILMESNNKHENLLKNTDDDFSFAFKLHFMTNYYNFYVECLSRKVSERKNDFLRRRFCM